MRLFASVASDVRGPKIVLAVETAIDVAQQE